MSPSDQLISAQLKEIIPYGTILGTCARDCQKQMEDGKEVLIPDNCSVVLNTVLNTINNESGPECYNEAVRQLNAHPNHQSQADHVPGNQQSPPALPGITFLEHHVWTVWFIVRR